MSVRGKKVDPLFAELARNSPNFGFLVSHDPVLAGLGAGAESYIFSDPPVALFKARQFGEALAQWLLGKTRTECFSSKQLDRLNALSDAGVLQGSVRTAFGVGEVVPCSNERGLYLSTPTLTVLYRFGECV